MFRYKWGLKKEQAYNCEVASVNPRLVKQPKDYLEKYFPLLSELVSYSAYQQQNAHKPVNYKLAGIFELNQPGVEYLLKLTLRPDGSLLVQVASNSMSAKIAQELVSNFAFLFQRESH